MKPSGPFAQCFPSNTIAFVCGLFACSACSPQEATVPSNWKTDCVGRMELSLPSSVDVAAMRGSDLADQFNTTISNRYPENRFDDGQIAGWTSFSYFGRIFVSQPLDGGAWLNLSDRVHRSRDRSKANRAKEESVKHDNSTQRDLSIAHLEGVGWQSKEHMRLVVRIGPSAVNWNVTFPPELAERAKSVHEFVVNGLTARELFNSPSASGICLPYTFIKDDGQQGRSIGVTYRLQEHPDVTIWLEDSSAQGTIVDMPGGTAVKAKDPTRFTPEYKTEFFWSQRYQDRKSYRSLWPGTRQVQLDGRRGVASLVELKRDDDTIDYGYLAVVRGDPEAKQDTPDLMLYVIRDAKNAIAKGKQPIDKDEFIKMAQSVAASVKHRPVQ